MAENGTTAAATDETNSIGAEQATTNETTNETTSDTANAAAGEEAANAEDVSYHAVEKDGNVAAIWEMQGRKHIRTIDPRSGEGKQILALFETAA